MLQTCSFSKLWSFRFIVEKVDSMLLRLWYMDRNSSELSRCHFNICPKVSTHARICSFWVLLLEYVLTNYEQNLWLRFCVWGSKPVCLPKDTWFSPFPSYILIHCNSITIRFFHLQIHPRLDKIGFTLVILILWGSG